MNPKPNTDNLSAWLDGELTDAEAAELEAELATDAELRAELESLESVMRLLREEGPSQAPLGFHHRVMARIEQEEAASAPWGQSGWGRSATWAWLRRPWGIPLEGWVLAAAAAAVLILVLPVWTSGPDAVRGESELGVPKELSPAAIELSEDVTKEVVTEEAVTQQAPPTSKGGPDVIGRATSDGTGMKVKPVPSSKEAPTGLVEAPKVELEKQAKSDELATNSGTNSATNTGTEIPDNSAYRYVVRSEDAGMKREILAIAARYGQATDLTRRPVTTAAMSAGVEELIVSLPQTDLPEFAADLKANGYVVDAANGGELVGGTTVEVRVRMELVGGATSGQGDEGVNNAARKTYDSEIQADEE